MRYVVALTYVFQVGQNLTELFLWAIVLFREIVGYQNLGLCVRSLVIKDAVHILHILQKYIYKQIQ